MTDPYRFDDGFDVVHHDEDGFTEVERQPGNEVLVFLADGRRVLINDVHDTEWRAYKRNPTTEALRHLLREHGFRFVN